MSRSVVSDIVEFWLIVTNMDDIKTLTILLGKMYIVKTFMQ